MKWMIWALALFSLVMAAGAGASDGMKQAMLEARYAQMECRAGFIYQVMDNAGQFSQEGEMAQERAQIQQQMMLMQQAAENGDSAAFNMEMAQARTAFTNGMNGARNAHQNALNKIEETPSGPGTPGGVQDESAPGAQNREQARAQMLQLHEQAQGEYASCMGNATRSRVQAEVGTFLEWHGKGTAVAESMKKRGYDVSGLEAVLEESEEASESLEEEIESTDDYVDMGEMRKNAWSKELYLSEKFNAERFRLVLDRIDENSGGMYSERTMAIRGVLDDALALGPNGTYTMEQATQARQLMNGAAEQIRDLLEEMSE